MKNDCAIIRDLLPLYVEKLASDETREYVQEHITGCEECRGLLESMAEPSDLPMDTGAGPLKTLSKQIRRRRTLTGLFVGVVVGVLILSCVGYLTAQVILPYSPGIVTVYEGENGVVSVCDENDARRHTRFDVSLMASSDSETFYRASVWTTRWDQVFGNYPSICSELTPDSRQNPATNIVIYYMTSTESTLIYGPDSYHGDAFPLPRLALGYYLVIAALACAVLGLVLFVVRKSMAKRVWAERLLALPVSYVIAHLCVKGFTVTTYYMQRDFSLIVLVTTLIYLLLLLALHFYHARLSRSLEFAEVQSPEDSESCETDQARGVEGASSR